MRSSESGQMDDLETPAHRIFGEDDVRAEPDAEQDDNSAGHNR